MASFRIPIPVIARVAQVLSDYGTHTQIDRWIRIAEAPADFGPNHNKEVKVSSALDGLNALHPEQALPALGRMLSDLLDADLERLHEGRAEIVAGWQDQVISALSDHGLRYLPGGKVVARGIAPTVESLSDSIRSRNWDAL